MGDLDGNGVIDLFEYAVEPDQLLLASATARIAAKGVLEVSADLAVREGGVKKRSLLRELTVSLPSTGSKQTIRPGNLAVFEDKKEVDLAAVRAKGSVEVRFEASLAFTDSTFQRRTLSLAVTRTLSVR